MKTRGSLTVAEPNELEAWVQEWRWERSSYFIIIIIIIY